MWWSILELYIKIIMYIIAFALFILGGILPIFLAIAENCIWWLLLYLISPMFFLGGFTIFEMTGDI
jgi:hypothetical protein